MRTILFAAFLFIAILNSIELNSRIIQQSDTIKKNELPSKLVDKYNQEDFEERGAAKYFRLISWQDSIINLKSKENDSLKEKLTFLENQSKINSKLNKKVKLFESNSNRLFKVVYLSFAASMLFLILFFIGVYQQKKIIKNDTLIKEINEQLSNSIAHKNELLKELNHRVKNNLSVLSSLLYLQQRKLGNNEAKNAMNDSIVRINNISLIHDSLYIQNEEDILNFQVYLNKMFTYIKSVYWKNKNEVISDISIENFKPSLTEAVPIAMIFNELITNSLKVSLKDIDLPTITIIINKNSVVYFDNGNNIPKQEESESISKKLLELFSSQLKMEYTIVKERNLLYHKFKMKDGY